MSDIDQLILGVTNKDIKILSECISLVENEGSRYQELLKTLHPSHETPVIGITGPPGAGKSTLLNCLLTQLAVVDARIAVLAVDPSSPFNYGALLGDRIRLKDHYDNANIFIRSIAARGSLGGLSEKIIEILEIVCSACFDYIFIETVGVGQAEVEISGIADTTVVVLAPEAGDGIQTMKAGIMEIADIFVINKADRKNSDMLANNLANMQQTKSDADQEIPVVKTIATEHQGISDLLEEIKKNNSSAVNKERKTLLLAQRAFKLIRHQKMKGIDKEQLKKTIAAQMVEKDFNLYGFVEENYFGK